MINKEQVSTLCEEALANSDHFLVEVKVKPNNVIEVYVDSDSAVNIDHCAELSRYINEKLDRDVEDYELSVLSWGPPVAEICGQGRGGEDQGDG